MSGYKLLPRARQDLKQIWHYSADRWGNDRADRYVQTIHRAFDVVSDEPRRGRPANEIRPGYRRFSVGAHVIFFRFHEGAVNIIRILHQSMDFDRHL